MRQAQIHSPTCDGLHSRSMAALMPGGMSMCLEAGAARDWAALYGRRITVRTCTAC